MQHETKWCYLFGKSKFALMKYLKILYVQVLIGIALGVLVGWQFPAFAPAAKIISDTFINMIRMVIAPVIFLRSCRAWRSG